MDEKKKTGRSCCAGHSRWMSSPMPSVEAGAGCWRPDGPNAVRAIPQHLQLPTWPAQWSVHEVLGHSHVAHAPSPSGRGDIHSPRTRSKDFVDTPLSWPQRRGAAICVWWTRGIGMPPQGSWRTRWPVRLKRSMRPSLPTTWPAPTTTKQVRPGWASSARRRSSIRRLRAKKTCS